ncbi:Carotenoid isomerooxygenase [Eumeta japonica]|uniref:Carotenoid isomerooxygenase n=1 Tax=Eumeta variegata TaxID=151549 RepID=A0A4C1SBL1_EUMVA|nr:Carotenoid isomerooxygenase [Eumeta japonica]
MQSNADYAEWFRGRPKRLTLPLGAPRPARVTPAPLADLGCETRIHYDLYNGRPYRYFYAISSDVDGDNPGTLIKVDTQSAKTTTWCETNCYPSEPIFVPTPGAKDEDDGVLLSALVWGAEKTHCVGLIVLNAKDMQEIARATFNTPSPAPKCLHGWFLPDRA